MEAGLAGADRAGKRGRARSEPRARYFGLISHQTSLIFCQMVGFGPIRGGSPPARSSWRPRHRLPGSPRLIAAASPSHLVVADGPVSGNGPHTYHLAVSTDGGLHWSAVITDRERINAAAPASAILGFENAKVGRWVGDERAIWTTRDGGVDWIRRTFP